MGHKTIAEGMKLVTMVTGWACKINYGFPEGDTCFYCGIKRVRNERDKVIGYEKRDK